MLGSPHALHFDDNLAAPLFPQCCPTRQDKYQVHGSIAFAFSHASNLQLCLAVAVMAKLSISERDRPTYNPNAQSLFQRLRSHWLSVAAIAWFLLSLHPVYHYLTSSTVRHTPRTAAVTVTETLAVPAIQATAIANSLGNTKFNHARIPDAIDTFRHFRQAQNCTMSSLDLHGPFEPLCKDRRSLMDAMTGGGRIGFDAPFSPRDCDMRWFSTEEICEIMGRFEKVFILGDSIMRNVAVAFHILLRADLVDGGRTTWADNPWEVVDCRCAGPFETSKCAFFSAVSTRVVRRHDPESLVCKDDMGGIECEFSSVCIAIL